MFTHARVDQMVQKPSPAQWFIDSSAHALSRSKKIGLDRGSKWAGATLASGLYAVSDWLDGSKSVPFVKQGSKPASLTTHLTPCLHWASFLGA